MFLACLLQCFFSFILTLSMIINHLFTGPSGKQYQRGETRKREMFSKCPKQKYFPLVLVAILIFSGVTASV